jgi:hypothetical protein
MSGKKSAGTTEHGFFEERLSAYLDGELTPREHEAMKHHLETCPACQWELETLSQTIQWMRELPTLTVPRVFTVPAPAEPARPARRRWNFLPVLQGATALIAVLLVFAVAGDLLLGSLGGSQSPDMAYQQEVASSDVEATQVVEKVVEAPAAAEAQIEMETVLETVVVESEMVVTRTEAPMALSVSPTESPAVGEGVVPAATPRAPAAAAAWESTEEVAEEGGEPAADAISPEPEQAVPPAEEAVAGGGEPALTLPAPSPLPLPSPLPTMAAPAESGAATELAFAPLVGRDEAATESSIVPNINWLRVVEVLLGAALFLLVFVTVFLTIERRKAQ